MVSSRSLSEVVSSQGRFIAAKKEQLRTPSQTHRAPRCPPPSLPAPLLQAPLPRRRSAPGDSFPRRCKSRDGHAPQRGRGPSASSRALPGYSPGPASLERCGFLLANMGGRTHAGQWRPKGVGRGVGTGPHTWEPGVALWRGLERRERAQAREPSGRGCRARTPGVWALLCKPQSLPPSFYPTFKE